MYSDRLSFSRARAPLDIKIRQHRARDATGSLQPAASPPSSRKLPSTTTPCLPQASTAAAQGISVRRGLYHARVRALTMRPIAAGVLSSLCTSVQRSFHNCGVRISHSPIHALPHFQLGPYRYLELSIAISSCLFAHRASCYVLLNVL